METRWFLGAAASAERSEHPQAQPVLPQELPAQHLSPNPFSLSLEGSEHDEDSSGIHLPPRAPFPAESPTARSCSPSPSINPALFWGARLGAGGLAGRTEPAWCALGAGSSPGKAQKCLDCHQGPACRVSPQPGCILWLASSLLAGFHSCCF